MTGTDSGERRRANDAGLESLRRETDYRFDAIAQRFLAQEQAVAAALAAAKEAVAKAELANDKRFDVVTDKIGVLTDSMNTLAGRSRGVATTLGVAIAVATLVISLVVFVVNYGFSK